MANIAFSSPFHYPLPVWFRICSPHATTERGSIHDSLMPYDEASISPCSPCCSNSIILTWHPYRIKDMHCFWYKQWGVISSVSMHWVPCSVHKRWPKYATFDKDESLQKEKFNRKYEWPRPVMWAMTNISEYELQIQICKVILTNTMWRIVLSNYVVHTAWNICGSQVIQTRMNKPVILMSKLNFKVLVSSKESDHD